MKLGGSEFGYLFVYVKNTIFINYLIWRDQRSHQLLKNILPNVGLNENDLVLGFYQSYGRPQYRNI